MTALDHFSVLAETYAKFRPSYPPELFAYLSQQLKSRGLAWDCATGNGQAALGLAPYFSKVIATDISAAQIEQAAPHPNIEYRIASAEACGLAASSVDLATTAEALHWFNIPAFLTEARRVLKPEGMLAIWVYNFCVSGSPKIDAIYSRFYHGTISPYWPPERAHVEDSYAKIELPIPRIEQPRFEIKQEMTCAQFCGYLRSWSAVKRYFDIHGVDPVESIEQELTACWRDEARLIHWPLTLFFGSP